MFVQLHAERGEVAARLLCVGEAARMPSRVCSAFDVLLGVVEEHRARGVKPEAGLCELVDVAVRLAQFLNARDDRAAEQCVELREALERVMERLA